MPRPKVKGFARQETPERLVFLQDLGVQLELPDPTGDIRRLVALLDGTRTVAEVSAALAESSSLSESDVEGGIEALDRAGLLEDAAAATRLTDVERDRYASNLIFFGTFADLGLSRFDLQERLLTATVVLLGVGGVGSTTLYSLAGLGVRHIRVVDHDRVELGNLSRQFLYEEAWIGERKVGRSAARIGSFNSQIEIEAIDREMRSAEDLAGVISGADLVLSTIDKPTEVRLWVNKACVSASVPFVTGGVGLARGMYFSVDPGSSGCLACVDSPETIEGTRADRANRAIGPTAALIGSLIALEGVRYLTRFAPPASAATVTLVDFLSGTVSPAQTWERRPDCPVCGGLA